MFPAAEAEYAVPRKEAPLNRSSKPSGSGGDGQEQGEKKKVKKRKKTPPMTE